MTTPEPLLRHKRKPGYDRGPDTEINRPVKYFGRTEADDRTEMLPAVARIGEEPTEVLPLVPVTPEESDDLSPAVKRLAYFTAIVLVTSASFALSGILAYCGWFLWTQVL